MTMIAHTKTYTFFDFIVGKSYVLEVMQFLAMLNSTNKYENPQSLSFRLRSGRGEFPRETLKFALRQSVEQGRFELVGGRGPSPWWGAP